jgi:DNA-binding CsgD family transcriptional regulator
MSVLSHSSTGARRRRQRSGRSGRPHAAAPSPGRKAAGRRAGAAKSVLAFADVEKTLGVTLAVARERLARLTERQRQVADLMARGKPNRQIAEALGISPKTLDIHRADVMHKLEAETVAQVANLANLLRLSELATADGSA